MNSNHLEHLNNLGFEDIQTDQLADIQSLKIEPSLPVEERIKKYCELVKNPYYFKVGKTPVRLRYKNNGKTIDEVIERHFLKAKMND